MDTLKLAALIALALILASCSLSGPEPMDAGPDAGAPDAAAAIDAGSGVCMDWCEIHHSDCLGLEWFACVRMCDADPGVMKHCE